MMRKWWAWYEQRGGAGHKQGQGGAGQARAETQQARISSGLPVRLRVWGGGGAGVSDPPAEDRNAPSLGALVRMTSAVAKRCTGGGTGIGTGTGTGTPAGSGKRLKLRQALLGWGQNYRVYNLGYRVQG